MNPSCSVCSNPATRVCKHQQCLVSPFLCSGPCINNSSQKMHTHDSNFNFIPYHQFQQKLQEIKNKLDPLVLHKQYLGQIKKKINIAKDDFKQKINFLDIVYQQLENDLCVDLKMRLEEEESETMLKIQQDFADKLTGKQINDLLFGYNKFVEETKTLAAIKCVQDSFKKELQKFCQLDFQGMFTSYKERVQKSKVLYAHGIKLADNNQYKEAARNLKQAKQINNFDDQIFFSIGYCLSELNQIEQSTQNYKLCLQLNPCSLHAHYNIGHNYRETQNFKEAIQWFSKGIEIGQADQEYFQQRGDCFLELGQYEKANIDFLKALELNPGNSEFIEKLEKIGKLINSKKK